MFRQPALSGYLTKFIAIRPSRFEARNRNMVMCTRRRSCTHDPDPHFSLHDSVLLERFNRTTSFFDGFPYQLFAASFFERPRENLGLGFGGHQQHPINVAENNISGADVRRSNLDRNAEVDYFVARGCILSVGIETECCEALLYEGLWRCRYQSSRRGRTWHEWILAGEVSGQRALARKLGMNERYVGRVLQCAFLAPDIVEDIINGRQPSDLTFATLTNRLPLSWVEQRKQLGFPLQPS